MEFVWNSRCWVQQSVSSGSGAMAMMGVVRRAGVLRNVARVICSAVGEAPRVVTGDCVLQRAVQVREASSFEPGFHWPKMIQAHHMSCCANLGNPPPREVCVQSCLTHFSYKFFFGG